jgi:hypothetical protein
VNFLKSIQGNKTHLNGYFLCTSYCRIHKNINNIIASHFNKEKRSTVPYQSRIVHSIKQLQNEERSTPCIEAISKQQTHYLRMPQCSSCSKEFPKSDFSKAQLKKPHDQRKCKNCVSEIQEQEHSNSQNTGDEPVAPTTTATTSSIHQGGDGDDDVSKLKSTIEQLQKELESTKQQMKEQEISHQEKAQELERKASEAFQGMERAKQRIASLESLAGETIASLKDVQTQASEEIESLRIALLKAETERDRLLAEQQTS